MYLNDNKSCCTHVFWESSNKNAHFNIFHFSRYLRCKNLLTMESWQHSSFEEKVDLDTIVLFPSDVSSSKGVQELNSGIKEEQFQDDTDIIVNSANNDVKTKKVKFMEEKSEFPLVHEMESESYDPDALEI